MRHPHQVANAFLQAQQLRHTADYDNATQWNWADALTLISKVGLAFESWRAIRDEPAVQTYLISLLGSPRDV